MMPGMLGAALCPPLRHINIRRWKEVRTRATEGGGKSDVGGQLSTVTFKKGWSFSKLKPVGQSSGAADSDQNKENLLSRAAQQRRGLPEGGSRESTQECGETATWSGPSSITERLCDHGKFPNLSVL